MAIGDAAPDLEMMRAAGLSMAMGNAPDDVKAQVDVVGPSNRTTAWRGRSGSLRCGRSASRQLAVHGLRSASRSAIARLRGARSPCGRRHDTDGSSIPHPEEEPCRCFRVTCCGRTASARSGRSSWAASRWGRRSSSRRRRRTPTGRSAIVGVRAGDDIAVHIEQIEMVGPYRAPNGGPFVEGMGRPVPLEYRDGWFYWPSGFRLRAEPSVGNVAVLPERSDEVMEAVREYSVGGRRWKNEKGWRRIVREPRGKHCHQDCRFAAEAAIVHLKAQVDGAGLCLDDVHGYLGEGELAFSGIEVNARVQVRVERSSGVARRLAADRNGRRAHAPLLVHIDVRASSAAEVRRCGAGGVPGVARCGDGASRRNDRGGELDRRDGRALRNCALYGLGDGYVPQDGGVAPYDIAVVACISKDVFGRSEGEQR